MEKTRVTAAFWKWCKENNLRPTNKRYDAFHAGYAFNVKTGP